MTQRKASRLLVEQLEDRLTPSTNEIPAGQFNWTQFSPTGTLSQLLWNGQTLVYQTWNGSSWDSQNVTTLTTFTLPSYSSRDQVMAATQTAQLVYTTDGTANALVLDKQWNYLQGGYQTLIYDYQLTNGNWKLAQTISPSGLTPWGPNNLVAEAGPNNSISLLFAETTVAAGAVGDVGTGYLEYATNQSGSWAFSQVAQTADLNADVWIEGMRYDPRFLSMAIAPSGAAYITYCPEFYISGAFGTVDSTLMLATNAGGSWTSSTVVAPSGPADAGLAASVAIAPDGTVGVASYYVQRYSTGSAEASWLDYSTLNPNGTWTTVTAVSTPDGYVAADGAHYTGFSPQLTYNAQNEPTIVFTDEAAQHLADTYENEFAGQIRTTTLANGTWDTNTVVPQTDPIENQMFYPVSTTYDGVTVYAGLDATTTVDGNDNPISTAFSVTDLTVPTTVSPPPPVVVSPPVVTSPPVTVSPPVVTSPPVVVSPPVVTSPPVTVSPPVVTSPPVTVSPPVVTSPPVIVSPPVVPPVVISPPVTVSPPPPTSPPLGNPTRTSPLPTSPPSPPAVIPVTAAATLAGTVTQVRVTYSNGAAYAWDPFGTKYKSGASVALGDVNGDGIPDIIVASGNSGTTGTVQVYDGKTRKLVASYTPMGAFGGGLDVAVGDVNGSGQEDIVVGVQSGGWPLVTVLNGATGQITDQFLAYPTSFGGGVQVAAADLNGDGDAEVVVSPGTGANGLPVEVFSGASVATGTANPQPLASFVPFAGYTGAVSLAVGELTKTGGEDIVLSTQTSGEQFEVYSGQSVVGSSSPKPLFKQNAWAAVDTTGVRVALVTDSSRNGLDDLIVTNGKGNRTARYLNTQLTSTGWPTKDAELFTAIPGVNTPIYIG